ncbi:hypothetical protein [Knoellia pratensis]|uniref:hypothetical protein n=1 Tax=Knoellia pratensis TaxID=3404796 RepID=UPI00362079AE
MRRTGTSADDFYPDPIDSPGSWLGMAGLFGLGAALVMMVVGLVNGVWEVRTERKAEARRLERETSADCPEPPTDPSSERPDSEEDPWPLHNPR